MLLYALMPQMVQTVPLDSLMASGGGLPTHDAEGLLCHRNSHSLCLSCLMSSYLFVTLTCRGTVVKV